MTMATVHGHLLAARQLLSGGSIRETFPFVRKSPAIPIRHFPAELDVSWQEATAKQIYIHQV